VIFAIAGVIAIVLWIRFASFENMAPRLDVNRTGAVNRADQELSDHEIQLAPNWKTLSRVEAPLNLNDRFIWQEEGDSVYFSLLDSYLGGPYWLVRYATFEGDVAARAEEYNVKIMRPDKITFTHILPEKAPGDSLDEDTARGLAVAAISDRFELNPDELKFVSATPSKLDNRTDWQFVWADTANHPLKSGECRLVISLAGSEVVDAYQMVYVPEEWSRAEREKNNLITILDYVMGAGPVLLLAVAFVFSIISWSRKIFDVRLFLKIAILITLVVLLNILNSWPSVKSMFVTAAPWMHQALLGIIFSVLGAVVVGMSLGMINGYIKATRLLSDNKVVKPLSALGAGFLIVAVGTLVQYVAPSLVPIWADYSDLGMRWPVLSLALGSITRFFVVGTVYLLIFNVTTRFTYTWTRRQVVAALLIILLGIVLTDVRSSGTIMFWLIGGLVKGVLLWLSYIFILRHRLSIAPFLFLPVLLLSSIKGFVHNAYPGAQLGHALSFVVLIIVAIVWEQWLQKSEIAD
jgi:hypothetical protein